MKKFGKRVLIFVGIIGVLYAVYMLMVMPGGYVDKNDLVNGYVDNLNSSDVCLDHFNEETQGHCAAMTELLKDHTVVVTSTVTSGDTLIVYLTVDGSEVDFVVSFVEVEVTGIKSVFNKTYILIDFMI